MEQKKTGELLTVLEKTRGQSNHAGIVWILTEFDFVHVELDRKLTHSGDVKEIGRYTIPVLEERFKLKIQIGELYGYMLRF